MKGQNKKLIARVEYLVAREGNPKYPFNYLLKNDTISYELLYYSNNYHQFIHFATEIRNKELSYEILSVVFTESRSESLQ